MIKKSALCFLLIILLGCAKKSVSAMPSMESDTRMRREMVSEQLPRKVVMNAQIALETKTPDSVCRSIIALAQRSQGYLVHSSGGSVTVRVPDTLLTAVLDSIVLLGKVKSRWITGQDVTEEYADLQIKLDNAESARRRYLELLAKAENVHAALEVEKELERLNKEIEMIKGREKYLREMSSYASVTVTVTKKVQPGPLGYLFYIPAKAVMKLFIWER